MRYFLEISYDGTNYSGWQVQPSKNTVQLQLNEALSTILSESILCTGCGRTDAGVHATQFYLHFDTGTTIPKNFSYKINKMLPKDIAVKRIIDVENEAHSRFNATLRTYQYRINFCKDPFLMKRSYHYQYTIPDLDKMNQASEKLLSYTDFKSLCKTGGGAKTTICHLTQSYWQLNKSKGQLVYTVSADRFLRGMVRMIVGVLLMVGRNKCSVKDLEQVMKKRDRFKYIMPVPAHALYLTSVKYPFLKN